MHNFIPNWLKLVAEGNLFEAAELSHQTNTLPEVCGRVCPQDACARARVRSMTALAQSLSAPPKNTSPIPRSPWAGAPICRGGGNGKTVAIIGAGPAGLGCADILARNGVKPVVFDRYPEIGGLLTFGIPEFKLEKVMVSGGNIRRHGNRVPAQH